jgi:hypothetical protein
MSIAVCQHCGRVPTTVKSTTHSIKLRHVVRVGVLLTTDTIQSKKKTPTGKPYFFVRLVGNGTLLLATAGDDDEETKKDFIARDFDR